MRKKVEKIEKKNPYFGKAQNIIVYTYFTLALILI